MAQHRRTHESKYKDFDIGTGPYLARVISHFDPTYMGNLEVTLLRKSGNAMGEDTQTFIVRYASPFFGYTSLEYAGNISGEANTHDGYDDTQKSYGMWMVPPDVGVTVMVMFIDGDPSQGYWLGCVPDNYTNRMVPGIAASEPAMFEMDSADKAKYDPKTPMPVAEINRRRNATEGREKDPRKIKKPTHPIVEHLYAEGLLEDDVRGVTSASARRDSPSMVFGISSPGPLDKTGKKGLIGTRDHNARNWVSRLGGTQFVMDDGNTTMNRKGHPSTTPMEYVADPDGLRNMPKDELFRVRTRTGHQLLFHNSEDLIYIANSRGTAWIELTSDGKIDIFASDSVSIHTQNDFNFYADRDFNLEVGRNINMKANTGRMQIEVATDYNLEIGNNGMITLKDGDLDINTSTDVRIEQGGNLDIKSGGYHHETCEGDHHTKATGNIVEESAENHTKASGDIVNKGSKVHMQGKEAQTAEPASPAEKVKPLPLHVNDKTGPEYDWKESRYQYVPPPKQEFQSIMKRIPMHEPWARKENLDPMNVKPDKTDREG